MISAFGNLHSLNDGMTKSVAVTAREDASGGMETITFNINGQIKSVQLNFASNQMQVVTVTHTASGTGLVEVTAANSPQSLTQMLNVDKIPGDDGNGWGP